MTRLLEIEASRTVLSRASCRAIVENYRSIDSLLLKRSAALRWLLKSKRVTVYAAGGEIPGGSNLSRGEFLASSRSSIDLRFAFFFVKKDDYFEV